MKIKKGTIWEKLIIPSVVVVLAVLTGVVVFSKKISQKNIIVTAKTAFNTEVELDEKPILPTETPTVKTGPMISVSPTSSPTSFEEMDQNYGPCVKVNVLIYHHIQSEEEAKPKNQNSLTVTPEFFRKQMEYLKNQNYNIIEPKDLMAFFNGEKKLSGKLAMITLDDGYEDNYKNAFPILKELGVKATVFIPTGLMNNPDYLTWDEMNQMKDVFYFGNHTWSHHSSSGTAEKIKEEISLADTQLKEKGFNDLKVFAYPYGTTNQSEINILKENGYDLAFTTKHGNVMCKQKSLELPRIRVGNSSLASYGL